MSIEDRYQRRDDLGEEAKGKAGTWYNSHSRIVIFHFGVKKSGLHEDEVGFPGGFIGNDKNGEVSIQKSSCLLRSCITIVISVKILVISINGAGVAVAVAIAVAIPVVLAVFVAVAIADFVACRTCIIVNFASRVDGHHSIAVVEFLHMVAAVHFDLVRTLSTVRGMDDRCSVMGLVRVIGIFEFDSGFK